MSLCSVIVGVGKWEQYTKPLLESIAEYMPGMTVVVVDNGSYYSPNGTESIADFIGTNEVLGYAEALNFGLANAPECDWYLILNNDILIEKPFSIEGFDKDCLYGFIKYPFKNYEYLAGWAMFISDKALDEVGLFDPELRPMWFEDADYCIRAQKAGYSLKVLDRKKVGIRHFEDENMQERKVYMRNNVHERRINRQYVERKHDL